MGRVNLAVLSLPVGVVATIPRAAPDFRRQVEGEKRVSRSRRPQFANLGHGSWVQSDSNERLRTPVRPPSRTRQKAGRPQEERSW